MPSNLPADWGNYRCTCGRCGKSYHLSGAEECDCPRLDEQARDEIARAEADAVTAMCAGEWRLAAGLYEECAAICEGRV